MISDMSHHNVTLLCFIVNNGLGNRVLRQARRLGISGGTVLLGHGSVNSQILDMFSLCDTRKEIVLMIAPKPLAMQALKALVVKIKLDRRDCGIAFAMEIEPEKEMVLILIEKALSQTIVDTIYAELEIEKAGNGIIFVLDVASAYGLVSSEDRLTGSSRSDAT